MKKAIGTLFLFALTLAWAASSFNDDKPQLMGFNFLNDKQKQNLFVPVENPSNPNNKSPELEDISSTHEIEQQFLSYKEVELRNEILRLENNLEAGELIKKANQQSLTKEEFKTLSFHLRKKSALHKILMDRAIEAEDQSL